ncbi:hypothetical protein CPLU01_00473 [Colletotrichum plurivorum]|uniref:Uncharacterized protein n=1 Tax=Colletotrichum plurivorum TaxID=2175906 RepID=A0A8H6NRR3_9PEZI|nr:hypothetical protein CPLU01_00473 [Colletotrichum plurivorum]
MGERAGPDVIVTSPTCPLRPPTNPENWSRVRVSFTQTPRRGEAAAACDRDTYIGHLQTQITLQDEAQGNLHLSPAEPQLSSSPTLIRPTLRKTPLGPGPCPVLSQAVHLTLIRLPTRAAGPGVFPPVLLFPSPSLFPPPRPVPSTAFSKGDDTRAGRDEGPAVLLLDPRPMYRPVPVLDTATLRFLQQLLTALVMKQLTYFSVEPEIAYPTD